MGRFDSKPRPELRQDNGAWVVAALACAQLVSWGSIFYGFSLFTVPMERELGWSRTALNGALSLGLLVSGVCAYPIGKWIDRYGGRVLMTIGSLLAALLFVAWSSATSLTGLFVVWIGFGAVMGATLYDPVFAVITRRYPSGFRNKIIALTLVGGFASTVFIPLTQLFIDQLGWRHALVALALCNLCICVPIHAWVLREAACEEWHDMRQREHAHRAGVARALRHPAFWGLTVCFTAYYGLFAAMTFHLIPLFIERGFGTATIVAAMALIGPAQVASRIGMLAFGTRLDTALIGCIVMLAFPAAVLILLFFHSSTFALFAAMLVYGGGNGMVTIIRGTAVPDLLWKEGYGAINGLLSLPSNIAKAAGPFGAAVIWTMGGYAAVLWVLLGVALLAVVGFWVAAATACAGK
ncbi:MAG: MFS transporter [Burkholderiales bacterium]|nr:MFS transporter [Burkholderiales bacterium]